MLEILPALLASAKNVAAGLLAFFAKPPGAYLGAALAAAILLLIAHHIGYGAGKNDCGAAHARAAAEALARGQHASAMVVGRSEARALEDDKTNRQNREQVRYVTLQAKTLFDGAVVCIPSPIADKLRGID